MTKRVTVAKPGTSSLAKLFPNPTVLDVLSALLLHPETEFYQRELADLIG